MKGHDAGLLQRAVEQGGDVGESDDRLGMLPERRKVDAIEDARHAITAANAPDGVDGGIPQGSVEVGQAIFIAPGEVPQAVARVRREHRFEAQRAAQLLGSGEVILLETRA